MLKKLCSDQTNVTKNELFFLSRAPTHHGSSTSFISVKTCVRMSIFDSVLFLSHLTKSMDSLTLKCHNSFQNENNRKEAKNSLLRGL